jgi:hypothetical protein
MSKFAVNYYSYVDQTNQESLRCFDEGPVVRKKYIGVNSSSIDTRGIDAFRQGVEITQEKYSVGMVKISAGTAGHIVEPKCYGINDLDIISKDAYYEIEYFNPVRYLSVGGVGGRNIEKIFTFPIITSDENQAQNRSFNGIIEPLSIRPVASHFSIEFPFESHSTKGSMMGGNSDVRYGASEQVLTVDYYPDLVNEDFYLDAFESISSGSSVPASSIYYVNHNFNHDPPFNDTLVYVETYGISEKKCGADMYKAIIALSGSTGDYIPPGKKSGTAGFVYDNIGRSGTDSIAFGGMTY